MLELRISPQWERGTLCGLRKIYLPGPSASQRYRWVKERSSTKAVCQLGTKLKSRATKVTKCGFLPEQMPKILLDQGAECMV